MISINLFCYYENVFILSEYMNEWERFNETSLPKKEEFYGNLNIEDITEADYMHAKK